MKEIPVRYRSHFVWSVLTPGGWACVRCGQQLQANSAGAQSHIAAHLRADYRDPAWRADQAVMTPKKGARA